MTIPKGQTTAFITATVTNNQTNTGNLDFFLNLTNPVQASITRSQALGVIVDENQLAVSVGAVTVQRTTTGSFTYNPSGGPAQVGTTFTVGPTTTTTQLLSALNSIPALNNKVTVTGNTGGPFTLTFSGGTSAALLQFANPGQLTSTSSTTATFTTPQTANVTFLLNGVTSQAVTVNFKTVNGTAKAGTDYTAVTNGSVVIPAGSQSVTVPITILGSTTAQNNKAFQVQVTSVVNAVAPAAAATVTIVDDNVVPAIIVGDVMSRQAINGIKTVQVPVYLSFANPTPITINYSTVDTGTNPAVAGTDYVAIPATNLVIPAGQTSFTIPVQFMGNLTAGPINPTFGLMINSVTGSATLARSTGVVTISSATSCRPPSATPRSAKYRAAPLPLSRCSSAAPASCRLP